MTRPSPGSDGSHLGRNGLGDQLVRDGVGGEEGAEAEQRDGRGRRRGNGVEAALPGRADGLEILARDGAPADPGDDHKGDWWDHVPEHRLVLAVVPGARSIENAEEVVAAVKSRTDGVAPRLMTSDEYPAYASAIEAAFGVPVTRPATGPGRRPILPGRRLPEGLTYATAHKEREADRVVAVERRLIFGTAVGLEAALGASSASRTVNTSFVERQHGTGLGGVGAWRGRGLAGSVGAWRGRGLAGLGGSRGLAGPGLGGSDRVSS